MKNFRNLIVLFLAINLIKCDDNGENTLCIGSAKSINDCNDLLSDVEKSEKPTFEKFAKTVGLSNEVFDICNEVIRMKSEE